MRRGLFWLISRLAIAVYGRFPIFGPLRGAVAIIRRADGFLVIERNDGLGLGFPGGNAHPWESDVQAVSREVREETALALEGLQFKFRFRSDVFYPVKTSVFEATASGAPSPSWEGRVIVVTLAELNRRIIPSQREIVTYLTTGVMPPTT
jgi:8-oxo-dGTP pyrophosphatase MutT (NUDIX family)